MSSHASWFLSGFILKQIYTYCRRSKVRVDKLWLRLLVLGTIVIQIVDTAASVYAAYGLNARQWGIPTGFLIGPIIGEDIGIMAVPLASSLTQIFYVWRIWTFSAAVGKNRLKILCRAASVLIVMLNICAAACGVFIFVESLLPNSVSYWFIFLLAMNASVGAADILITVFMTILLSSARGQTNFRGTRGALSRISRITLQSGFLTTFLTVCAVILNGVGVGIYAIFWELSTKSYAITLFANLNARSRSRGNVEHLPSEHEHDQGHDSLHGFSNQVHSHFSGETNQASGESQGQF